MKNELSAAIHDDLPDDGGEWPLPTACVHCSGRLDGEEARESGVCDVCANARIAAAARLRPWWERIGERGEPGGDA